MRISVPVKIALIGVCALFFFQFNLKSESDIEQGKAYVYIGKWEINGGVNKLYDTPLGAVYQFALSDYFNFSRLYRKDRKKSIYCLQFDLPLAYKNNKEKYRFVVIEFRLRTFPAVSECENPKLVFSLTRSLSNANSISMYGNLNGISYFETGKVWHGISTILNSPYWPARKRLPPVWFLDCFSRYLPYYGIAACRIIFDTAEGGVVSTNVNGAKFIEYHHEISKKSPLGNSYGICMQYDRATLPRKPVPRRLLEISSPKIILTNNESDLRSLPRIGIVEYPYSQYPALEERKVRREKNPDQLYAHAMRLSGGKDLVQAVEVLERAAKEEHVFAMYQLGVCYYRGLGVDANTEKAVKWLRKAAEYSLPEAWALLGVVAFRNSGSVYLFESDRKLISESRYAFVPGQRQKRLNKAGTGKHDNWVFASMLYSCEAIPYPWIKSPKCGLWMARNAYIKQYYANVIDPELKSECAKTAPPKPWIAWEPRTVKKLDDFKNVQTVVLPKGFKRPGDKDISDKRRPWSDFYEIRVVGLTQGPDSKTILDDAVKQGYWPAILYKGRLCAEVWHKPEEALELFEQGGKLGSLACELEALHCCARSGKLKPEDFTAALEVKFADYPLYYMLRYMVRNPDAPGVKEFLAQKYETARQLWRQKPSHWSDFLLGAEALYQYFNYGFDTAYYRIYWQKTEDLTKAFAYLDSAAKANIVPAMYLAGKQYIEGVRRKTRIDTGDTVGMELLSRASKAGHIKAQYLLLKKRFESRYYPKDEWLRLLSSARKAGSADAWLLSTDIYAKIHNYSPNYSKNVLNGYERAAKLGCHLAWDRLARIYYYGKGVPESKEKAAQYWEKFVKRDREIRSQDINDLYWEKCEKPVIEKYDKDGLPVPRGTTKQSKKEQKHYFSTY